MPANSIGPTAKNATLTFRLPEKLKTQAAQTAKQKKFRSIGQYVATLIERDVGEVRKAA